MSGLLLLGCGGGVTTILEPPLTNLQLWLKGSSITGVSDGGSVNTWPDSSGNGRDQAASPNPPTYVASGPGGYPGVAFNGSNQGFGGASGTLVTSLAGSGNTYTIMAVFRADAVSSSDAMASYNNIGLSCDNGGNIGIHLANSGAQGKLKGYLWTGADTRVVSDFAIGSLTRYTYYRDTANDTIYGRVGSGSFASASAANDAAPGSRLQFGRNYAGGGWFQGVLSEFLVWSKALDGQELGQADAYLLGKYGV